VLLLGSRLVDRDLPVALGPAPIDDLERVEALVAGRIDADGDAVSLPIALPFASTSRTSSSIEPCARRTPGRACTSLSTADENAGASVSPSAVLIATFELITASVASYESA
jgi:hypothetical protein